MTELRKKVVKKFGDEDLSDVCLVVGNADFHVHKQVLACQSKVFKAMFYDAFNGKSRDRIEIDDADPLAFQRILEMIYNQEMSDENFLRCRYSGSSDAFWKQSTALWKVIDRFDMAACQKTFVKLLEKYSSKKISSFLVARLTDEPKSLKAIDFMQKNNFSYRISTNSTLLNVLMSSSGAEETRLAGEQLENIFESVEVKVEDTGDQNDDQKSGVRPPKVNSVENQLEVNAQLNEPMETVQDEKASGDGHLEEKEQPPAPLNAQVENTVESPLLDASTTADGHIPPSIDFPDTAEDDEDVTIKNERILDDSDDAIMDFYDSTFDDKGNDSMDEDLAVEHEENDSDEEDEDHEEEEDDENESKAKNEENEDDASSANEEEDVTDPKKKKGSQEKKNRKRVSNSISYHLLYACPVKNCPISYSLFPRLLEHAKTHEDKENFFCEVCKTDFASREAATKHIQERLKKECCACQKKFATCQTLQWHLRSHTGEKPYKCSYCSRRFIQKQGLSEHERTHTGEKPFKCGYCSRRFTQKHHMVVHERMHTGERPFSCRKCNKTYTTSSALTLHNKTKHKLEKKKQ